MLGFGKSPESGRHPEYIKLPTPTEYVGSYFEKSEQKTDEDRAVELLRIRNLAEKGQ